MGPAPQYTAVVHRKTSSQLPILDSKGKATGQHEVVKSDTIDHPLTDEAGNVVQAGTPDALLRRVREHFETVDGVEVQKVIVLETRPVREISGEELAKL